MIKFRRLGPGRVQDFLERRRRVLRWWRWVGPLCLLLIVIFLSWLYLTTPLLVNPLEVARRLEEGVLADSTLMIMAAMLPVVFLACFGLLVAIVVLGFAAFANERRYLDIISERARPDEVDR